MTNSFCLRIKFEKEEITLFYICVSLYERMFQKTIDSYSLQNIKKKKVLIKFVYVFHEN